MIEQREAIEMRLILQTILTRCTLLVMSVLLLMSIVLVVTPTEQMEVQATPAPTVNIGDYIQFGKYNNAPILFANRILTLKAFDAGG